MNASLYMRDIRAHGVISYADGHWDIVEDRKDYDRLCWDIEAGVPWVRIPQQGDREPALASTRHITRVRWIPEQKKSPSRHSEP